MVSSESAFLLWDVNPFSLECNCAVRMTQIVCSRVKNIVQNIHIEEHASISFLPP